MALKPHWCQYQHQRAEDSSHIFDSWQGSLFTILTNTKHKPTSYQCSWAPKVTILFFQGPTFLNFADQMGPFRVNVVKINETEITSLTFIKLSLRMRKENHHHSGKINWMDNDEKKCLLNKKSELSLDWKKWWVELIGKKLQFLLFCNQPTNQPVEEWNWAALLQKLVLSW